MRNRWKTLDQLVAPAEHPELDLSFSRLFGASAGLAPWVARVAPTIGADELVLVTNLGDSQVPAAAAALPSPLALALAIIAGQYLPAKSSLSELTRAVNRSE